MSTKISINFQPPKNRSARKDDTSINDQRDIIVDFADQLITHFKSVLPDIWRLWILYSTGTMIHNDPAQSTKIKQAAFSHTKEVKRLFSDEILFTMNMARGALLPETLKPSNAQVRVENSNVIFRSFFSEHLTKRCNISGSSNRK